MSAAPLLAAVGGACAAAAIVELAAAAAWRRSAPSGPSAGGRAGRVARVVTALARAGRRAGAPAAPGDLGTRIAAAGEPLDLPVADVMALKCGAAAAAGLAGLSMASLAPGRLGIVMLAAAPAAGFLAPDLVLHRLARARIAAVTLELPDIAELLRVAVEAGLPPARAIAEVGRRHRGLLAGELLAAARLVDLGVPRADALDRLVTRVPEPGVRSLVAAVRRSERHGAPLAPALAALAAEARAERARCVRDRAARAAPKIQLVVALLLVPSVLLLVAAALTAALL